ncbi:MAG: SGNH/GDSL hydrolase family protein [Pseudonocardiales bacterium]|nr:SGNH/GDSL hydrolase family protein [Pseudonocardiales bacterium]
MTTGFEYSNLSGRPPGPVLRVLSRVLPGVRRVQEQVVPYARAWQEHNRRALAAEGPLWVALGDSLTVGIGAPAHDRGWVGQLAARMPGWRVVNLAVSGGRVRDVLDRQLPALAALGQEPDLVTLLIGNNDLVSPRLRPALPADLAELLRRMPPGTVVGNQPATYAAALEVNRIVDEAVARRGLRLAELRDPRTRNWTGKLAEDHFHPDERGYAGIAAVFGEAIGR